MRPSHPRSTGFTLVELMVAMTLIGLVLISVLPFTIFNMQSQFVSTQKLLVNGDVRAFTNGMIDDGDGASCFALYQSFYPRTLSTGTAVARDFDGNGTINSGDRLQAGQSGDFVVFVYYQDPFYDSRFYDSDPNNQPAVGSNVTVDRLVCYWLAPNRNYSGETALYRLDTDDFKTSSTSTSWTTPWGATFPSTLTSAVTLESLLPSNTESAATDSRYANIVLNNLEGLSSGLNFVNFQGRAIQVRSRILHGNEAKRVTNTYNFTVTPRG